MKRDKFLLLVLLLAGYAYAGATAQTIGLKVSTSANWPAGRWSVVNLEISGASGAGPCRYVQDFPMGFSVKAADTGGGDLFFDNNRLSIVWSKLPAGTLTTVSFQVMPDRALSGMVEMGGLFYAVTGAGRRSVVEVPAKQILIDAGGVAAGESQQVTVSAKSVPQRVTPERSSATARLEPENRQAPAVQFRVQVLSSSSAISDTELKKRLGISFNEGVTVIPAASIYKYQVGECPSFDCAAQLLERFKKAGVTGAFIVAFHGAEQITVEKARSLTR